MNGFLAVGHNEDGTLKDVKTGLDGYSSEWTHYGFDANGPEVDNTGVSMSPSVGVNSQPLAGNPAFRAWAGGGATVALDGGGMPVKNIAPGVDSTDAATVGQIVESGSFMHINAMATALLPGGLAVYLSHEGDYPIDPITFTIGNFYDSKTAFCGHADPADIFQFGIFQTYHLDTSNNGYWDMTVNVLIQDLGGNNANSMILQGHVYDNVHEAQHSVTVSPSDLAVFAQTGTDLSYDPETGIVTAGISGFWIVNISYQASWD